MFGNFDIIPSSGLWSTDFSLHGVMLPCCTHRNWSLRVSFMLLHPLTIWLWAKHNNMPALHLFTRAATLGQSRMYCSTLPLIQKTLICSLPFAFLLNLPHCIHCPGCTVLDSRKGPDPIHILVEVKGPAFPTKMECSLQTSFGSSYQPWCSIESMDGVAIPSVLKGMDPVELCSSWGLVHGLDLRPWRKMF